MPPLCEVNILPSSLKLIPVFDPHHSNQITYEQMAVMKAAQKHLTHNLTACCCVCAMCEFLLAATPHTLACRLTSLSRIFSQPHDPPHPPPPPPPDASHLLITPANLVEVRAQAAKCPPCSHSHNLSLSSSEGLPNMGQSGWGCLHGELDGEREEVSAYLRQR